MFHNQVDVYFKVQLNMIKNRLGEIEFELLSEQKKMRSKLV